MTKKEKMNQIREAEKIAAIPKPNPEYKKGKRSHTEVFNGIVRNKYLNEWLD
jgi:hypothetical protein